MPVDWRGYILFLFLDGRQLPLHVSFSFSHSTRLSAGAVTHIGCVVFLHL